ncbi:hypothetical protein AAIH06_36200, partial [Pseudomonas aeruginosa]
NGLTGQFYRQFALTIAISTGLSCLALGLFGYIYFTSPSMPSPARIVSVKVVGNGGAIYEVLYVSGGATVPFVYRYFLMVLKDCDQPVSPGCATLTWH